MKKDFINIHDLLHELTNLLEHYSAGLPSIELNYLPLLKEKTNQLFKVTVNNEEFLTSSAIQNKWTEILSISFDSELHDHLANSIDEDDFITLGNSLISSLNTYRDESSIRFIHSYLNIFRLSTFLVKLKHTKKWEVLIKDLIQFSNFNFVSLFQQRKNQYGSKSLFKVISGKKVFNYSWEHTWEHITDFSLALIHQLDKTGSTNSKVAFLMENSIEMAFLDLACLTTGLVNVMIPANTVDEHIKFILNQTKAELILVSNEKLLVKIQKVKQDTTYLKQAIIVHGTSSDNWVMNFKEFLVFDRSLYTEDLIKKRNSLEINDLATIMYTSGTTGEPKGIMFSNLNIVYKRFCRAMALPCISDKDRFLAYLPLFHTFGRYLEMTGSIFWGAEYIFMENPSIETLLDNVGIVKPTVFISIPKKWMQLYEHIHSKVDVEFADEKVIKDVVDTATGGKLKWGLSAAGFLSPEIFTFFQKYGIELMSGFGMTEATGGITMTPPRKYIENSLGVPLPGIDVKLAEDGELLIKGNYVMIGYFGEENSKTFNEEGWFATGDIMTRNHDGYYFIIDRKKEIYKNVKGETVAPQKIENFFKDFDFIHQVFLVGDHKPFNTLLIYPNFEAEIFNTLKKDNQSINDYFASVVVSINKFLSPFERIIDFRIIDRPFLLEKEEITPKGTYKRWVIENNFTHIINEMYLKNYMSLNWNGFEIRIPNWFLREKGCLNRDVVIDDKSIAIPKFNITLNLDLIENNVVRIGDYFYTFENSKIDFQSLLTNPELWLGNKNLYDFTGDSIIRWYRLPDNNCKIEFHSSVGQYTIDNNLKLSFSQILYSDEKSFNGLHAAIIHLQSTDEINALMAITYLKQIIEEDSLVIYRASLKMLQRPILTSFTEVRRELLRTSSTVFKGKEFLKILETYLSLNFNILDEHMIQHIVDNVTDEELNSIEILLNNNINSTSHEDALTKTPIPSLFELLCSYGVYHPTRYEKLRQAFVKYQIMKEYEELVLIAARTRRKMREGFRNWLGSNLKLAVDPETGSEYRWKDVIVFDDAVNENDKKQIIRACTETVLIREAIFLFSKGILVGLNNILPGGIYISLFRVFPEKTIYKAVIQTRHQGSFEILLNLYNDSYRETILEEINWLILAGSRYFITELIEDFGGFWGDYNLWTARYMPGETVERYFLKELKKKDSFLDMKLLSIWPFFIWNTSAAHFNFIRLTGRRLELANPSPDNFIVPFHDYQTGTRVVSFSERKISSTLIDTFDNYYRKFILPIENKYPVLKQISCWNYIFSGLINSEGLDIGMKMLHDYREELINFGGFEYLDDVLNKLDLFVKTVNEFGFMPKPLYFAIKRFIRWSNLNHDASSTAKAETLHDLYETYHLTQLEKNYPDTRTRFFFETVFFSSSDDFKGFITELLNRQRAGVPVEEINTMIADVKLRFELNSEEEYFLTRLLYPYLKPGDNAILMKAKAESEKGTNLVVQYEDKDGNSFVVRKPVTPKEISKLHQLFIESNLIVNFKPEHQFLVAISEREYIIGGLFYYASDKENVRMEKIVVSSKYRGKGISEFLMTDFMNRLKSENFKSVSTGFFRPEYFYHFGFKIEKKYSGLVKELV